MVLAFLQPWFESTSIPSGILWNIELSLELRKASFDAHLIKSQRRWGSYVPTCRRARHNADFSLWLHAHFGILSWGRWISAHATLSQCTGRCCFHIFCCCCVSMFFCGSEDLWKLSQHFGSRWEKPGGWPFDYQEEARVVWVCAGAQHLRQVGNWWASGSVDSLWALD